MLMVVTTKQLPNDCMLTNLVPIIGTHDTNKYGYICVPCVAPDCLGLLHPLGTGMHKLENGPDIDRSLKLFGLSSVPNITEGSEVSLTFIIVTHIKLVDSLDLFF